MKRMISITVVVAVLVAAAMLAGCPKKEQAELQGAPSANQPPPAGTHTMPGGQQMPGMTMPGDKTKAATETPAAGTTTAATSEMVSCPVLGTTMSKDKMIPYEYKGKTYYFCCPPCVEKFKANPEKYIKNPAPPKPAGEGMKMGD